MERQDLQDKMDHQDPKVAVVRMAYVVQWAFLDVVYLELQDLQETRARWASSASQDPGAQRV